MRRLRLPALCLCVALAAAPLAAGATASLDDPEDLERFASGWLEAELREREVPGAVLVMARAGEVAFARGFGRADLGRDVPVDPERTLFRVASVSKLFTATAAMQLVERGALALDDDVNLAVVGEEDAGREAPPALARLATAIGLVACGGWLALLAGLAGLLASLPPGALLQDTPRALPLVLTPGVAAALATFPFLAFVLLAGARGWWSPGFRLHFALVALGAGALLAVLHDWNLVGFHY